MAAKHRTRTPAGLTSRRRNTQYYFQFPGHSDQGWAQPDAKLIVGYQSDGENRAYVTGEASAFYPTSTGLPGFRHLTNPFTHGEHRDTINLTIQARAPRGDRGYDILATFAYDPRPAVFEGHDYGFRFTAGRLPPSHHTAARPGEHTNVYQLLDNVLTDLYRTADMS